MVTGGKNGSFKPKAFVIYYREVEPCNVKEAFSHDHWRKAMTEEYDALMRNHTWDLVTQPLN